MGLLSAFIPAIAFAGSQLVPITASADTTVCTMDARQCPDGSWVGRSGPKCEFKCNGSGSVDSDVNSGNSSSGTAGPAIMKKMCPQFTRSLKQGMRGDDVSQLQDYLGISQTGYFGPMTARALMKLQSDEGVSAVGVLGPQTRAVFARRCGQQAGTQALTATPTSGSAPLTVAFATNDSISASSTYSVDFGDGQNASMTKSNCVGIAAIRGGEGGIRCSFDVSHTYTQDGTYTAKLLKQKPWSCPNGMMCAMMMPAPETVASATVTVGTGASASVPFSASPTFGSAPLAVSFSTMISGFGTQGRYTIDFGDGSSETPTSCNAPADACIAPGINTHTYAKSGIYTAKLLYVTNPCPAGAQCFVAPITKTLSEVKISVGDVSNGQTIQKITAPENVTLATEGIAEVRNQSYYFTLKSLTASSATIEITRVGCWNSFPSDPKPKVICMIAIMPTPPVTLTIGQTNSDSNYPVTLTGIHADSATFAVGLKTSGQ